MPFNYLFTWTSQEYTNICNQQLYLSGPQIHGFERWTLRRNKYVIGVSSNDPLVITSDFICSLAAMTVLESYDVTKYYPNFFLELAEFWEATDFRQNKRNNH